MRWPTILLRDAGTWLSGGTPARDNASFWGGSIPWIGSKDLKSFDLDDSSEFVTEAGAANGTRIINAGTVLFVTRGMSLAKEFRVGVALRRLAFNQDVKAIVPKATLDGRFLAWFLVASQADILDKVDTASHGTKRLPLERIEGMQVPLPPLLEQRRISAILDKAHAIHRKRQKAMALTDELLRSTFLEMFGDPISNPKLWPMGQLGDIVDLYAGNSLPEGIQFSGQEGGFLLLKVGDMNINGNEAEIHTAREWARSVPRAAIVAPPGSIVIPKRGGAIATNKKRILMRPAALDPNLMAIAPGPSVRLPYLRQWFSGVDLTTLSNGTAVPQLNKKDLDPIRLPVPPLDVQERFGVIADKVRTMGSRIEAALTMSNALSQSLIQRAFSGEL